MDTFDTNSDRGILLNLLSEFIGFRSIQESPKQKQECLDWAATAFFVEDLDRLRRGRETDAPYLFLTHPDPKLLIFAHTDVVPAYDDQYTLRIEGDRAYGRGTKDMKGASLPFLYAYRKARQQGIVPPVEILLTSDEEVGGHSLPRILETEEIRSPVAMTPDTGEYRHLVFEHKGGVWGKLTAHGTGGHGAMPWTVDNPVWKLARALAQLEQAFPPGTQDEWQMTMSPTKLKGSDAGNKVPDTATCMLDIRFPAHICKTGEEALDIVREHVPEDCTLQEYMSTTPLYTDPDHPMIRRFCSMMKEVTGEETKLGREPGATDARYFSECGIPAFLFGPEGGELHGRNEWVSVPDLLDHLKLFERLFLSFTESKNEGS